MSWVDEPCASQRGERRFRDGVELHEQDRVRPSKVATGLARHPRAERRRKSCDECGYLTPGATLQSTLHNRDRSEHQARMPSASRVVTPTAWRDEAEPHRRILTLEDLDGLRGVRESRTRDLTQPADRAQAIAARHERANLVPLLSARNRARR